MPCAAEASSSFPPASQCVTMFCLTGSVRIASEVQNLNLLFQSYIRASELIGAALWGPHVFISFDAFFKRVFRLCVLPLTRIHVARAVRVAGCAQSCQSPARIITMYCRLRTMSVLTRTLSVHVFKILLLEQLKSLDTSTSIFYVFAGFYTVETYWRHQIFKLNAKTYHVMYILMGIVDHLL